jgi:predicted phosphodiesterase
METPAGRIAVLSDIHGVLPALESVLAEPEVTSADRIVLTGDLAAGPQPRETLDRLASLGDRAVWIRGNADRELVELARGEVSTVPDPIAPWAAAQLRADQVALLAGLPLTATLEVAGLGPVLFCHATPRDDEEVVLADSRLERWGDVLGSVRPEVAVVVCGHTHMPFSRLAHGRLVVQPGQRRDAVRPGRSALGAARAGGAAAADRVRRRGGLRPRCRAVVVPGRRGMGGLLHQRPGHRRGGPGRHGPPGRPGRRERPRGAEPPRLKATWISATTWAGARVICGQVKCTTS